MAGSVLAELYVDVTARGVEETARRLRSLTQAGQETARQMTAVGRAGADAMNRLGGSTRGAAGEVSKLGGGGSGLSGLASQLGAVSKAALALAPVAAAIGAITSGFQGTSELEVFGQTMMQVAREAASLFAPALRLATDLTQQLLTTFRSTGTAGQFFASGLGLLTPALTALSNPAFQAAAMSLVRAFGQMVQAAQPLINLAANLSQAFLNAFVVQPLVTFINLVTVLVEKMQQLAVFASAAAAALLGAVGRGNMLNAPGGGQRRAVTMSATGTEDAQGTFQRLQQAILKSGVKEDKSVPEQQLEQLRLMREKVDGIFNFISEFVGGAADAATPVAPQNFAEGAIAALPGGMAFLHGRKMLGQMLGGR